MSLDVSPNYVVLGSSIGSVYVFARCAEFGGLRDPARTKIESPEGPLRFLERFLVETHSGASASKPIVGIRLNPDCTRCALAFEDGDLVVVEFSMGDGGERKTGRVSGRYEAGIPEAHRDATITSLSWSPAGDAFVCGDNSGVCSVVVLEGKHSGAHTVRFKQPIAQVSFLEEGTAALVSTSTQLYMLYQQDGYGKTTVGSKPRDGPYGATSHPLAHLAIPEGLELDMLGANAAATHSWFFGARPGRRLWLCRVPHGSAVPHGEVVVTLRPSLPEASVPPGGVMPAKLPKKWEFGRMYPIGPCMLSVSERALAVIDFVGAAVLAWYPMDPKLSGAGAGIAHHRLGQAVEGPRMFMIGGDGGLWSMQVPHTAAALVRSTAMLAAAASTGPDTTEDEKALLADPGYHAKRLAARFGIDPPQMPQPLRRIVMGPTRNGVSEGADEGGEDGGERPERLSVAVDENNERGQELAGAIAAMSAAGDGAAAAARAAAVAMFDEADPLKWRNGGMGAAGGAGDGGSAAFLSFPPANVVGGNDFPTVSEADKPIGIITRTRNQRSKRSATKRVVGIEDISPMPPIVTDVPSSDARDDPPVVTHPSADTSPSNVADGKENANGEEKSSSSGSTNGASALPSPPRSAPPPKAAPLGSTVGVLKQFHEDKIKYESATATGLASAEVYGLEFRSALRRGKVTEGEGSDDDTMSTASEALTERTEGGDGFFFGRPAAIMGAEIGGGRLASLLQPGPVESGTRTGFGSPLPREEAAPSPPVVVDDEGNLRLDDLDVSVISNTGKDSVGKSWGAVAEEGNAAMSPSIDLWLEKKEEARRNTEAMARQSVMTSPGPTTPQVEEDEYDVMVREAASLALELERVAKAEAREAEEEDEDMLEEEDGGTPRLGRSGSRTRLNDESDFSSDEDEDRSGTPLPFGATLATPPTGLRQDSAAEAGAGIPNSPQPSSATRVAPISPWPWWMVMLGCDGCGTVRSNKTHKLEDEAASTASPTALSSGFMGSLFGGPSVGALPASLSGPVNSVD